MTATMQFKTRLHDLIRAGIVTTSIRIWKSARVKVGGRYTLGAGPGYIIVLSLKEMELNDIDEKMAISSGFEGINDLLSVAQHGTGKRVFLVVFEYHDGLGSSA